MQGRLLDSNKLQASSKSGCKVVHDTFMRMSFISPSSAAILMTTGSLLIKGGSLLDKDAGCCTQDS